MRGSCLVVCGCVMAVSNSPGGSWGRTRSCAYNSNISPPITHLTGILREKTVVWGLKRSQECGGDRQWRAAGADVAAHLCSFCSSGWGGDKLPVCCSVLRILFLHMPCGDQKCPTTPVPCQGGSPMCLVAVGHLHSHSVGLLLAPGSEGRAPHTGIVFGKIWSGHTGRVFDSTVLFLLLGASAWDSQNGLCKEAEPRCGNRSYHLRIIQVWKSLHSPLVRGSGKQKHLFI